MVGAETTGFIGLGRVGGEGRDLATPRRRKLQRKVAKAADTDHADAGSGQNVVGEERLEHGHAGTQQRTGAGAIDPFGQGNGPCPVGAHLVGKAAVVLQDGGHRSCAQVLIARQAGLAVHAAFGGPADAHMLTQVQALGMGAQCADRADDLMAGNEWIAGVAPFIANHRQIRVTDPAVLDGDLDLFVAKFTGVDGGQAEGLIGCGGNPTANL